ncbi:MAG: hypothetical protein HY862_21520 [Chloroflexi bacterium]|nr:hypothetical protein [Chloroflexota bacterium]
MKPMEDFNQRLTAAEAMSGEARITALLELLRAYRPILLLMHETLHELEHSIDRIEPLPQRLGFMHQLEIVMQQCGYSRTTLYQSKIDQVRETLNKESDL